MKTLQIIQVYFLRLCGSQRELGDSSLSSKRQFYQSERSRLKIDLSFVLKAPLSLLNNSASRLEFKGDSHVRRAGVQWQGAVSQGSCSAATLMAAAAAAVEFDKMSLRCKCKHTGKSYKAVWRDNVKLGSNAIQVVEFSARGSVK